MFRRARTAALLCAVSFSVAALTAATGPARDATASSGDAKVIVFFGDSLTAGYGLGPGQAFPALIQEKINSLGWNFRVVNAGVSGETTAGGLRRINSVLQQPVDVFVLELGANDGLRGLPVEEAKQNLQAIIDRVKNKYPQVQVVLAGMQVLSSPGRDYAARFRAIFPEIAAANKAPLIPFLLEGVGGIPALNLPDGIHPTPAGQKIVAENVWKVLQPVLEAAR